MRELLGCVVAVAIVLGLVYAAQSVGESTYDKRSHAETAEQDSQSAEPTEEKPETERADAPGVLPLKCVIVISDGYRAHGTGIPGLNPPAGDLGLLRPVGEIIASELPAAARQHFRDVTVVSSGEQAADADVVITPGRWK
jgi:hypothetical protein